MKWGLKWGYNWKRRDITEGSMCTMLSQWELHFKLTDWGVAGHLYLFRRCLEGIWKLRNSSPWIGWIARLTVNWTVEGKDISAVDEAPEVRVPCGGRVSRCASVGAVLKCEIYRWLPCWSWKQLTCRDVEVLQILDVCAVNRPKTFTSFCYSQPSVKYTQRVHKYTQSAVMMKNAPLHVLWNSFAASGLQLCSQISHMCWLTPGLLENVTGVTGVLLSLLSGCLFHDFPEVQWKDFAMKEWKHNPLPAPFLMVGWWVGNHFSVKRNPSCAPNIGPI